ncbi:Retrovirus-related Pol polyprotein, partial [Mucuna pruriens]
MAEEDREKTTFITFSGTFCYKVMPFGRKNAGTTYQRAMVTLFHDMIHKEIEVYVDDMITKSKSPEQHLKDLRKLFAKLRKYRLRLNLTKCTFGVKTGKLLGFVVNERDIEIDLDKVKSIREMPIPKTDSKVRAKIDPIKYILEKPALTRRIARWQMALSEYDIIYVNRSAIKGSSLAEHLAYHPLTDPQPVYHEFPDEHIMAATKIEP